MNKLILYVCAWICLHSCGFSKSQEESMLEYALSQAGDNRKELEYVIKYYEGDSLKREAARFLIRNMVYHFGYEKRERVSDITTLSSDYLIRNIELAFQAWPKPWNKSVSFENFCRYILPYRGLYEPPSGLREELMRTYLPLLDSSHIDNTYDAAVRLQKILRTRVTYQTEIPIHYPTVLFLPIARSGFSLFCVRLKADAIWHPPVLP